MKFLNASLPFLLASVVSLALTACGDADGDEPKKAEESAPPAGGSTTPGIGAAPGQEPAVSPETIVVTVNGKPITQGEIDSELAGMLFGGMKVEPARLAAFRKQFGPQAEKRLIEQALLEQAADAEGIKASEEEVAKRWKDIEARIPAGLDKAAFLQSKGWSVEDADKQIRMVVRLEELLNKHAAGEVVTDEAVRKHFDENKKQFETPEQVHARHILIKLPPGASAEDKAAVKAKIEGFKNEVAEKGLPHFQELAKQHSGCPSGQKGGSLGFFGRGQMVPEFDKVAFDLKPGTVSDPVLTQFGWHILLVEEKREAGLREFEDVKAQLKQRLVMQGKQKAQMAYVESLKQSAKIERPAGTGK